MRDAAETSHRRGKPTRLSRPNSRYPAACGIAVMAKASAPGRTKTRLVPPLNHDQAAALNTAFLGDVMENIRAAARETSIAGYVAFGPAGSTAFFQERVGPDIDLFEACLPDFGQCLQLALRKLLDREHRAAIVLNSDSPTLPTALLVEAAEVLARPDDQLVLGPATDGGYYLLGAKQLNARLFEDIAWSTSRVAAQTIDRARELSLHVHLLAPWYDVDDADALRMLHDELTGARAFNPALTPYHAPHTAELMDALVRKLDLPAAPTLARAAV